MPLRFLDDFDPAQEPARGVGVAVAESEHRIANNLAIIAGMVRAATVKLRNDDQRDFNHAIAVLADLSIRIEAVAQLHRLLMQRGQAQIDLAEYLREVIKAAKAALDDAGDRIGFDERATFEAHPRRAAAIGLFLSEAITNALKYADGAPIRVALWMSENDLLLEVSDHGPGLPLGFVEENGDGFGLMRALASQLNGRIELHKSNGTGLSVRLVMPPK